MLTGMADPVYDVGGMATRKHAPSRKRTPEPSQLIPFNFRIPAGLVDAFDEWLQERNRSKPLAHITRSDLIRGVLEWAARTRPDWEGK